MDKFQHEFQNFLLKNPWKFSGAHQQGETVEEKGEVGVPSFAAISSGTEEEDLYGAAGLCADVLAMLLIASAQ